MNKLFFRSLVCVVGLISSLSSCNTSKPIDPSTISKLTFPHGKEETLLRDNEAPETLEYAISLYFLENEAHAFQGEMEIKLANKHLQQETIELLLTLNLVGGEIIVQDDQGKSYNGVRMSVPRPEDGLIHLSFSGSLPEDLELSGANFSTTDSHSFAAAFPRVAVLEADGWDKGNPARFGDISNSELARYQITLYHLKQYEIAGNARLVEEREEDQYSVSFLQTPPVRDLALILLSGYEVREFTKDGILYRSWYPDFFSDREAEVMQFAVDSLGYFEEEYGVYPYSFLDIIAVPSPVLGLEFMGCIFINERLLTPDERFGTLSSAELLESVVVHEIAHQWLYGILGNDQTQEPWVDEALAQYLTYRYLKKILWTSSQCRF
jgi:hypothetical protein